TIGVKTPTGEMRVSTPEATALDLVRYPEHCGGLSNVATVLQELAERLDGGELVRIAEADGEVAYAQRLGYLLDRVGRQEVARALRGGTALHKLGLAPPRRYSEDIDLVQVEAGPIGAVLDRVRARLDPWLGKPTWDHAASTVTLVYRFMSEIPPVNRLRLKVE